MTAAGYMDLPCGCRAYVRPGNGGAPEMRRVYLCARQYCATNEPVQPRVMAALAAGVALTPREGAWPHPIHGADPRTLAA